MLSASSWLSLILSTTSLKLAANSFIYCVVVAVQLNSPGAQRATEEPKLHHLSARRVDIAEPPPPSIAIEIDPGHEHITSLGIASSCSSISPLSPTIRLISFSPAACNKHRLRWY